MVVLNDYFKETLKMILAENELGAKQQVSAYVKDLLEKLDKCEEITEKE